MSEIGTGYRSRWFNTVRGIAPSTIRSTSLPSKTILRKVKNFLIFIFTKKYFLFTKKFFKFKILY